MIETARGNSKPYEKRLDANLQKFFDSVAEQTIGKSEYIHKLCTTYSTPRDGHSKELLFFTIIGGPQDESKKITFNQMMNIFVLTMINMNTGKQLDFSTRSKYISQLLNKFRQNGIRYSTKDFKGAGEFNGVIQSDYNKQKEIDPTLGTGQNMVEFDEYGNEKILGLLNDGKLTSWTDSLHLLQCIAMGFGMCFGFRGRSEMSKCKWEYLKLEVDPLTGLRMVTAAPAGEFDKMHNLSLNNPMEQKGKPYVVDHPTNPNHLVKLIYKYRDMCDADQEQFFCRPSVKLTSKYKFQKNNHYGQNPIAGWIKEIAEIADFKDFAKYTPHQNRKQCGTGLYSNPNIPMEVKLKHMRHSKPASAARYMHTNRVVTASLQEGINGGLAGTESLFPATNAASTKPVVATEATTVLVTHKIASTTPVVATKASTLAPAPATILCLPQASKGSNNKSYRYSDNDQSIPDASSNNRKCSRNNYEMEKVTEENKKLKDELAIEKNRFDDEHTAFKSFKKKHTIVLQELLHHEQVIDGFESSTLEDDLRQEVESLQNELTAKEHELTAKTMFIREQATHAQQKVADHNHLLLNYHQNQNVLNRLQTQVHGLNTNVTEKNDEIHTLQTQILYFQQEQLRQQQQQQQMYDMVVQHRQQPNNQQQNGQQQNKREGILM